MMNHQEWSLLNDEKCSNASYINDERTTTSYQQQYHRFGGAKSPADLFKIYKQKNNDTQSAEQKFTGDLSSNKGVTKPYQQDNTQSGEQDLMGNFLSTNTGDILDQETVSDETNSLGDYNDQESLTNHGVNNTGRHNWDRTLIQKAFRTDKDPKEFLRIHETLGPQYAKQYMMGTFSSKPEETPEDSNVSTVHEKVKRDFKTDKDPQVFLRIHQTQGPEEAVRYLTGALSTRQDTPELQQSRSHPWDEEPCHIYQNDGPEAAKKYSIDSQYKALWHQSPIPQEESYNSVDGTDQKDVLLKKLTGYESNVCSSEGTFEQIKPRSEYNSSSNGYSDTTDNDLYTEQKLKPKYDFSDGSDTDDSDDTAVTSRPHTALSAGVHSTCRGRYNLVRKRDSYQIAKMHEKSLRQPNRSCSNDSNHHSDRAHSCRSRQWSRSTGSTYSTSSLGSSSSSETYDTSRQSRYSNTYGTSSYCRSQRRHRKNSDSSSTTISTDSSSSSGYDRQDWSELDYEVSYSASKTSRRSTAKSGISKRSNKRNNRHLAYDVSRRRRQNVSSSDSQSQSTDTSSASFENYKECSSINEINNDGSDCDSDSSGQLTDRRPNSRELKSYNCYLAYDYRVNNFRYAVNPRKPLRFVAVCINRRIRQSKTINNENDNNTSDDDELFVPIRRSGNSSASSSSSSNSDGQKPLQEDWVPESRTSGGYYDLSSRTSSSGDTSYISERPPSNRMPDSETAVSYISKASYAHAQRSSRSSSTSESSLVSALQDDNNSNKHPLLKAQDLMWSGPAPTQSVYSSLSSHSSLDSASINYSHTESEDYSVPQNPGSSDGCTSAYSEVSSISGDHQLTKQIRSKHTPSFVQGSTSDSSSSTDTQSSASSSLSTNLGLSSFPADFWKPKPSLESRGFRLAYLGGYYPTTGSNHDQSQSSSTSNSSSPGLSLPFLPDRIEVSESSVESESSSGYSTPSQETSYCHNSGDSTPLLDEPSRKRSCPTSFYSAKRPKAE